MEVCIINEDIRLKTAEEYESNILRVIKNMLSQNERIVFATVAENAGVTNLVIRQYPQLRNYILAKIKYYKEKHIINEKIDKAVTSLLKNNKSLTFVAIVKRCGFDSNTIFQNQNIKDKIRKVLST